MRGKAEANGWTIWDSALDNEYTANKFGVDGVGMSLRIYTEGPVEPTPEQERTDDTPVTVALSLSTRG